MDLTDEIMTDRTKYPDEMKIQLAGGAEITVGEFRNKLMPKADFTRYSESAKKKEQELTQALEGNNRLLAQALDERKRLEDEGKKPKVVTREGELSDEDLLNDQVLGPIVRRQQKLEAELEKAQGIIKAQGDQIVGHERTWTRQNFATTIAALKARDTDLDVNEFLTYSQRKPVIDVETGQVDLEDTYKNFAHNRLVEKARKEGEESGIEKGKKLVVPAIPFGRAALPPRPEGLPESLQDLKDETVLADPEMQAAMRGQ